MKKAIPVLIALVLIIVVAGAAFGSKIIERYTYSREEADLYEYFHIIKEEEVPIVLQEELIEAKALMQDGHCYFDLETVHTYFNERFYVDETEQLLLYTTPTEVIRSNIGSTVYQVDGAENEAGYCISFSRQQGDSMTYYVAVDFVKQYTDLSYEVFENPYRMQVYTSWEDREVADIKKDTNVRLLGGVKSPILRAIAAGEQVVILEKMETWCKVQTNDAFIGYVENKYLENERTETPETMAFPQRPEYTSLTKEEKICLGWHAIYADSGNASLDEVTANAASLTVIAPTWFSINDNSGTLRSFAAASYVERAHEKGLEVWGVVDDFNYKNDTGSDISLNEVLSATTSRTNLIEQILQGAADSGMDGINIDFENVNETCGEDFIQFLRELSIRCRKEGLVLSVDNYVPYDFNSYYDLEEQGVLVDYVIIMGYDEHWAGSPEAGSVASLGYVKYGIEKAEEMVPHNKIVNALPFYTRLWKTEGTTVTSEAYPMTTVEKVLSDNDMESWWDEETSQNYAEARQGDTLYQMWIEDAQSIGAKLTLMQGHDLGGVAAWRLGFEPPVVWDLIGAYLAQ